MDVFIIGQVIWSVHCKNIPKRVIRDKLKSKEVFKQEIKSSFKFLP